MNPLAILSFLKSDLFKYIAIAGIVMLIVFGIFHAGELNRQKDWDASIAAAEKAKL